ncbi:Protein of unknown function [Bacillus cereus]|nr:Protein of unknown function [Bacillus cereus]
MKKDIEKFFQDNLTMYPHYLMKVIISY